MADDTTVYLSTAYLGTVLYYAEIKKSKQHFVENREHFIKQTYRNRCTILGANGTMDVIPIQKRSGEKQLINKVAVSCIEDWQRMHWQSIISAYHSAPFFEYYADYFEPLYKVKYDLLFEFNCALHHTVLKVLKLSSQCEFTSQYVKDYGKYDFRYTFSPKIKLEHKFKEYYQVFSNKYDFQENLSIIDLIFNEGPRAAEFL